MKKEAREAGFIFILVSVGIFALAGGAAVLSVAINSAENRHTLNTLSDPNASSEQLSSITDQQLTNVRNDFATNASLLTGYAQLGTPTLPNGESSVVVAASAIEEQLRGTAVPEVINYMSNPSSSWNQNGGKNRPTGGTSPTGGIPPDDVPGGEGDVRISLVWSATVDLDLHAIDPCGNEIYYITDLGTCNGQTGTLDVDNVPGGPGSAENIYWPTGGAPSGNYEYWVHCYGGCSERPASYTLSRTVNGQRTTSGGTLTSTGAQSEHILFTR